MMSLGGNVRTRRLGVPKFRRIVCKLNQGKFAMGDKGSKDKGNREQKKTAQHTAKEKRKLQQEKKNKTV